MCGVELVRKLAEMGERIFSMDRARELIPSVGISNGYLPEALHHLARSGWIIRLRRGLYALGPAVSGSAPLHEFEVAMTLVSPAAISHWSALHHHGLTEQIPRTVFVTTTARRIPRSPGRDREVPERGYRVGKMVFRFVQTKRERFFGVKDAWVGEARVKITDPERTLLDGLMMPRHCGDFAEVLHAFRMRGPEIDMDRIMGYALKLDAATAKRLGWVLERQGVDPGRLSRLQEAPIAGYRPLDPSGPRRGPCDKRWMIQVNLPGRIQA